MVIGIGTDIVEIERISDVLNRQGDKFVERILTESEQEQYQQSHQKAAFLAKRFAAKEAVAKALGTGIGHRVSFQDMVITNDVKGAPQISLSGGAAKILAKKEGSVVLISISDERDYAIAYAVLSS